MCECLFSLLIGNVECKLNFCIHLLLFLDLYLRIRFHDLTHYQYGSMACVFSVLVIPMNQIWHLLAYTMTLNCRILKRGYGASIYEMGDPSFLDRMINHLCATSKYVHHTSII